MEEQAILEGLRQNHIKSYEQLIEQYACYVAAVMIKVAGGRLSKEMIEELSADVFIKLWQKRRELQIEEGKLKAYLARMARNHSLNELRNQGKLEVIPLEEEHIDYETPETEIIKEEDKRLIEEVLRTLPEPDHEIFIRRYFYMEKILDIGAALGLNAQTVGTKLFRGKKKLEQALKERGISYE